MKIRYARVTRIEKDTALQARRLPRISMQGSIDTAGMVLLRLCGVKTGSLEEICPIVGVSRTAFFRYLMSNRQRQEPARGNA